MSPARHARSAALCAFLLAAAALPAVCAGAAESLGPVVLSRAHGDALAVWDATPDLSALIAAKSTASDTLRRLESDAVAVLVEKSKSLAPDAKTLTVQVIYQRTGAISPTYQVATFAGIEKLLTVKAPVPVTDANVSAWQQQLKAGKVPDGLTVTVAGKLPPELH